jgi:hypothetical protein
MVLREMTVECSAKIAMIALRCASAAMRLLLEIVFRRGAFFLMLARDESLIEKQAEAFGPHPLANYRAIDRSSHGRMQMIKPLTERMTKYFSPKRARASKKA